MSDEEVKIILDECYKETDVVMKKLKYNKVKVEKKYIYIIKSKCYLLKGKFDKCKHYANKAIELMNDESVFIPELYADIALCEYKQDNFAKSRNHFYTALEYAEINDNKESTNRVILELIIIFILESIYEQALFLITRLDLEFLKSIKNKRLYILAIANISILNYSLHNIYEGNKYKDIFFEIYDNEISNKNIHGLKYLILKSENEAKGNYKEAIKNVDKIGENCSLHNDMIFYFKNMKNKAVLYKKIGDEQTAIRILLNVCKAAEKLEYYMLSLDVIDEIVAWGYEEKIPRQLCINLLLVGIKNNKQEVKEGIIMDLKNLKEIIEIKKQEKKQLENNKDLENTLEKFKLKSNCDPLTNVYNRRYLNEVFDSKKCLIKKYTTLAMMDIDDFKGINDNYGHIFGDRALIEISTMIKFTMGYNGKIFRYGGDEFFLLYNHDELHEGEEIIKKIFEKAKMLRINNIIQGHEISLSIGALTNYESIRCKTDVYSLLKKCDDILYNVKKNGKDNYKVEYKV
ncbi:MAG: GGDEF domain-containing protein [Clostridium sp.]|uniref:GGDEF domain-containing protein n=1 Tax=Clostridium sp. TaxID=1506 RepID=UPI003F36A277